MSWPRWVAGYLASLGVTLLFVAGANSKHHPDGGEDVNDEGTTPSE